MEVLSTNPNVDDVVDPINTSPPLFGHHVYLVSVVQREKMWALEPCPLHWGMVDP